MFIYPGAANRYNSRTFGGKQLNSITFRKLQSVLVLLNEVGRES